MISDIQLDGKVQRPTSMLDKQAQLKKIQKREALLKKAIGSPTGLKKIAAALSNPVRRKLDYVGISRKFLVTEIWPDGMPIIFDRDIEEFSASVIAKNGSTRYIEIEVERVELTPFQVTVNPRIPFTELYSRLYQVVKRAKERIATAIKNKAYFICLNPFYRTTH